MGIGWVLKISYFPNHRLPVLPASNTGTTGKCHLCLTLIAQDLPSGHPSEKSLTPLPKAHVPKAPLAGQERGELAQQRLLKQRQHGTGVHAAAVSASAAAAAGVVPSSTPLRAAAALPTGAARTPSSTAATAGTPFGTSAASTITPGSGTGASSLLPLLMDSLPFTVTVIAQSSTRVLYQNGPSKAYHGAYDPETSGTGDDLLRNLFSMCQASDHDQLLKVCW